VESEASEIGKALTSVMQLFERITNPFAGLLDKLPLPSNVRWLKAKQRLDSTILPNNRRAPRRAELIAAICCPMLMAAQDDEGDGGMMTDAQLRDEAMTLFVAGHETTANALTWTWYLLSQHRDVEARMHAEIDSVLAARIPAADDVAKLRYTEMVFAESMRLYPPAWTLGRRVLSDYQVGEYVFACGLYRSNESVGNSSRCSILSRAIQIRPGALDS